MELHSLKDIKQQFFTYRNGMMGDSLRNNGDTHSIIFGLNIPQISLIANSINKDKGLAIELWNNKTTRESQLLAPLIFPLDELTIEIANTWIASIPNQEIADNLCHKLLRYSDFAEDLALKLISSEIELTKYTGFRLLLNLMTLNKIKDIEQIKSIIQIADGDSNNIKYLKVMLKDYVEDTI